MEISSGVFTIRISIRKFVASTTLSGLNTPSSAATKRVSSIPTLPDLSSPSSLSAAIAASVTPIYGSSSMPLTKDAISRSSSVAKFSAKV